MQDSKADKRAIQRIHYQRIFEAGLCLVKAQRQKYLWEQTHKEKYPYEVQLEYRDNK